MDIKKELSDNLSVLLIFRKEYYNESIFEMLRGLAGKKVCYVTLNKTAASLHQAFKLHNIPTDNIFFIDAVSLGIGKQKKYDNVVMISSPAALTELSIAITESLQSNVFDVLLFDSLSTLNIYEIGNSAERFVSYTISKVRSEARKGIFTCLEDDLNTSLIKTSFMEVDKILRFNDFYDALEKKKQNLTFTSVTVIILLVSLSFFWGGAGNQVTGFAVLENIHFDPKLFFMLFVILLIVTFYVYKTGIIKSIDNKILLAIKPLKHDKDKLKKEIKEKIHKWFSKKKDR